MLLLLQEDLPDTAAELEAEIEMLEGWLEQTHQLLELKGFPRPVVTGEWHQDFGSWAATSCPETDAHSGPHQTGPAKHIVEQAVNAHLGSRTAQAHPQELDDDPIEETQRSVGAIDAALCAQGFRWR